MVLAAWVTPAGADDALRKEPWSVIWTIVAAAGLICLFFFLRRTVRGGAAALERPGRPDGCREYPRQLRLDLLNPVIDRAQAEDALRQHFEVIGLDLPPVRWVDDAVEAVRELARSEVSEMRSYVEAWAGLWDAYSYGPWAGGNSPSAQLMWLSHHTRARLRLVFVRTGGPTFPIDHSRDFDVLYWAALATQLANEARVDAIEDRLLDLCRPLVDACEAGLWIYGVTDRAVIALPRPGIHVDAEGCLHREDGPAVTWPGREHYFWRDMPVPWQLVLDPEAFLPDEIIAEPHREIKRVMIERIGMGRFLSAVGAEPVHSDETGDLYRIETPDDDPMVVVEIKDSARADGSQRPVFLHVLPRIQRAREAVAWTFQVDEDEWWIAELGMRTMYRQGSVLLVALAPGNSLSPWARARPREGDRLVLAEETRTGPDHSIASPRRCARREAAPCSSAGWSATPSWPERRPRRAMWTWRSTASAPSGWARSSGRSAR